jgi:hypothetical protein
MRAETLDSKADRFPADNDATFRQQILDISRAERKTMVGPNSMGDDLPRITKAFQGGMDDGIFMPKILPKSAVANNLAMPS